MFLRKLPTHKPFTLITRFASTLPSRYAILIGGGRAGRLSDKYFNAYAEHNSYLSIKHAVSELTGRFCPHENISVLFGSGENPPQTIRDYRLWTRPYHKYLSDEPLIVNDNEPIHITRSNTIASLENEFERLARLIKAGDLLIMYLDGHGSKFTGTILWNKHLTTEVLGAAFLDKLLDAIHPDAEVVVFISSCSSGNYLKLNRSNVTVLTNTSLSRVAYYSLKKQNESFLKSIKYLVDDQDSNLLLAQAKGCLLDGNFYASDSLSYYLDQQTKQLMPQQWILNLHDAYHRAMIRIKGNKRSFISNHIGEGIILGGILALPQDSALYQGLSNYIDFKFGLVILKKSPFIFKILFAALFTKTHAYLKERIVKTDIYKNYPSFEDKLLVKYLEKNQNSYTKITSLPEEGMEFVKTHQETLVAMLSKLYELRQSALTEPVISKYIYLFDKALLFVLISLHTQQFSAVMQFLKIAQRTIDPMNRNIVDKQHRAAVTRLLITHSIFRDVPTEIVAETKHLDPQKKL